MVSAGPVLRAEPARRAPHQRTGRGRRGDGPIGRALLQGNQLTQTGGSERPRSCSSPVAPAGARIPSLGGGDGNRALCSQSLSHVRLFATPWSVAWQAPLSMGFSRQEYWRGLPYPPLGDLPNPEIKPMSPAPPALHADSLPLSHWGSTKPS